MQNLDGLKEQTALWDQMLKETEELEELMDLSKNDISLETEIRQKLKDLIETYRAHEFEILLSGEYDEHNALLFIHSGTGGIDAQDFSEILLRMFLRFSETKKWTTTIIEKTLGDEAGIKSAAVEIKGYYAYGFLHGEAGIHRLVRMSPFDADKQRHTSFSLVEVIPELPTTQKIDLNEEDLKIDVFRASGHGGQGVNTTDSAVRITHKPTKIVVTCQNERSQMQNRETAMRVLQARILEHKRQEEIEKMAKVRGEHLEASWGNQIRSYVMHPYQMVKDHRTNFSTADIQNILDGNIGLFINSYLHWQANLKNNDKNN